MPTMDGIEFPWSVREDRPNLPFILYTGKDFEEVAAEALPAGVSDYLQKESGPDQYALLANRTRNLFGHHRAELPRLSRAVGRPRLDRRSATGKQPNGRRPSRRRERINAF